MSLGVEFVLWQGTELIIIIIIDRHIAQSLSMKRMLGSSGAGFFLSLLEMHLLHWVNCITADARSETGVSLLFSFHYSCRVHVCVRTVLPHSDRWARHTFFLWSGFEFCVCNFICRCVLRCLCYGKSLAAHGRPFCARQTLLPPCMCWRDPAISPAPCSVIPFENELNSMQRMGSLLILVRVVFTFPLNHHPGTPEAQCHPPATNCPGQWVVSAVAVHDSAVPLTWLMGPRRLPTRMPCAGLNSAASVSKRLLCDHLFDDCCG